MELSLKKASKSSLARKLIFTILLSSSLITLILTAFQMFLEYRDEMKILDKNIKGINLTQTATLGHLIWNLDEESIKIILMNNLKTTGVEYLEVKTLENKIMKAGKITSKSVIKRKYPIYVDKRDFKVGDITIIAGVDYINDKILKKILILLGGNALKTILVTLIAIIAIHIFITRHLVNIADHIGSICAGNFGETFQIKRKRKQNDELDLIVSAINTMSIKLEKTFSILKSEVERRKNNEIALRENEDRLRSAFENIPDLLIIYNRDLRIQFINRATTEFTGKEAKELIGRRDDEIWPEEVHIKYLEPLRKSFIDGLQRIIETEITINNKVHSIIITIVPVKDNEGSVKEVLGITRDLTEKKNLELLLNRSRKMEAIGRLAGGIAHDFNNLLSIIIGYTQLMIDNETLGEEISEFVNEIDSAAVRAKNLTAKLLAFSRKQILEKKTVDLNEVITKFMKLLEKLITENITLKYKLMKEPCFVKADVSQIEQVLINLVVNARDAIEDNRGEILIETGEVFLDEEYAMTRIETVPGRYIMLAVSDTGEGMESELIELIFDPFFTTKEKVKGTGLGLSTVYGIVKQHRGNISVYSEPSRGSIFRIYLPIADSHREAVVKRGDKPESIVNTGLIMVVEDELQLKNMVYRILSTCGFEIIETENAIDAVEKAKKIKKKIDLLITDVIMPDFNGPEVYSKIKESHPETKVLYMSGYSGSLISKQGVLKDGISFIQKPFSKDEFLKKIESVLSLNID